MNFASLRGHISLSGGYGDRRSWIQISGLSGFTQESRNNLRSLKQREFNSDDWLTGEGKTEKADGAY